MGGPPTPLGNFGRGGKQLFRGGNCPACPYCCYAPAPLIPSNYTKMKPN